MPRHRRSSQTTPLALALLGFVALSSFAPAASAETTDPAASPAPLRFSLSAEGLPEKGMWKSTPIFADVNGDGNVDLAAHIRLGTGPKVWLGDGKGHWTESSEGLTYEEASSCGGGLRLADVNGDTRLDLVVADHCGGVYVFLGDGKGKWQAVTSKMNPEAAAKVAEGDLNTFLGAEDVLVTDVNGDGRQDLIVVAADEGGFTVYLGDGSGKAWTEVKGDGLPSLDDPEPLDESKAGWAMELVAHDMNGDGHTDVVASYYAGLRVWLNDGKGKWRAAWEGLPSPMVGGLFRGLAVGDINGDGRPDLTAANSVNGVEVFLQKADGSWQSTPDPMPPLRGGAEALALADFDGDGRMDLAVGGRLRPPQAAPPGPTPAPASALQPAYYGLFLLLNDGKGGWTQVDAGLPETGLEVTWGMAAADVNGDKRPDVAVGVGGDIGAPPTVELPHVQVWLNSPTP